MTRGKLSFNSQAEHRQWLNSQSALPIGFKAGTTSFEFEPKEMNAKAQMKVTLLQCDPPTRDFAAVFTRNAFPGAPVIVGRERLKNEALGALVINNKVSNVGAENGVANAEAVCQAVADELGIQAEEVLPGSTGVIGWQLPVDSIVAALPKAVESLQTETILPAAEAIMTTDLYPKVRSVRVGDGRIVGIAKGAGMIEPNLATMLVYILTDVAVPRDDLRKSLSRAVDVSFNAISIDSDQSTSDTVALVSSGRIPCEDKNEFYQSLEAVCLALAEDVVRNGEGVKHVMRVKITGASSLELARGLGKSVINSPLVQCAVAGNDPNVGRLLMAIGKYIGNHSPETDTGKCRVSIGGEEVFADGVFKLDPSREEVLTDYLKAAQLYESAPPDADGIFSPPVSWPTHEKTVDILVDLEDGDAEFEVFGADRTHEYISENADYRT